MSADGPIYHKYNVDRTDGAETDPDSKHYGGCFYWVLDLDHDPFAAAAVSAYAEACHRTHPDLAAALRGELINRDRAKRGLPPWAPESVDADILALGGVENPEAP